jgi:hypothetical protein
MTFGAEALGMPLHLRRRYPRAWIRVAKPCVLGDNLNEAADTPLQRLQRTCPAVCPAGQMLVGESLLRPDVPAMVPVHLSSWRMRAR